MKKHTLLPLILILFLFSCQNHQKSKKLQEALTVASDNRGELEHALNFYKNKDSLKYEATKFLVENMMHHYSLSGEKLRSYYQEIAKLNEKYKNDSDINGCLRGYDSLNTCYADMLTTAIVSPDIKTVTADYLIKNVDQAFDRWRKGEWAKQLSFDQFCEYLLPYRVENEPLEYWRDTLEKQYLNRISWVAEREDWRYLTCNAATYLNDQLKLKGFRIGTISSNMLNFPPSVLTNIKTGTCYDYVAATTFIMRSCGIPVVIDYVPQWPTRSNSHSWNVLLNNDGKTIPFMGGERNPGQSVKLGSKKGKVFRKTFGYQEASLFHQNQQYGEKIPAKLNSPFILDVSAEYFDYQHVVVELTNKPLKETHFVYLAVFNDQTWIPIQWDHYNGGKTATFKNMEHDIVYMPVFYIDGEIQSAGFPFILTIDNKIETLKPDKKRMEVVTISRKFPRLSDVSWYSDRMVGGKIEAANDPFYKNGTEITTITRFPNMTWDTVLVDTITQKAYRYWRFIAAKDKPCNVAELEFIQNGININDSGRITGDNEVNPTYSKEKAFDKDGLTYYESKSAGNGWIGIDFGKSVTITKINYLPRNDDNNVWPGDSYELFYWDKNGKVSLGKQIAKTYSLTFENVPTHALLLLHNLTRGKEERIFTYESGKQIWW